MKRILLFALNALLLLSLSSCGSSKEESTPAPKPGGNQQSADQVIPPTTVTGKVYLAGDSLVCIWPESSRPKSGWGEYLQAALGNSPKGAVPNVINKAISGRSTKSFITTGDWDTLIALVGENDLVLIQFAANDGSTGDKGCTTEEYAVNLKKFISTTFWKHYTRTILIDKLYRFFSIRRIHIVVLYNRRIMQRHTQPFITIQTRM